ncbi:MAG TPA: lipid A export permease/ATP-binding protein MsbA [Verrucomicrobiae bacterium]|nr:lipid A export permease/ATP-binding protein MsbA [Verrucomicrobiae bacterium]
MPYGPPTLNRNAAPATDRAIYGRLLRYSAPHWKVFLIAIAGMVLFAAVDTSFIRLIQPLLDGSFVERDPQVIRLVPLAILGLFVLRGIAGFVSAYGMAWVSQRVVMELRAQVFEHMLRLPVSHHDRTRNADMLVKLTYHTNQVADSATGVLTAIFKDGLTIIGLLWVMSFMSWKLTLIALVVAPFVASSVRWVSGRFKVLNQRLQDSMGGVSHVADEAITGRRIVKIYGGEGYESGRFREVTEFIRRQSLKVAASGAGASGVVQLLAAIAVALIVYLAVSTDMLRSQTPGTFAAFLGAMLAIRGPLNALTNISERLTRGLVAAHDLFQFIDVAPEPPGGTRDLARARGEIRFEDVRFRYAEDAKPALDGVTLDVPRGQTVAFVGRSGSGKSTLLSLLPRFYDPSHGAIRLDGHDLRDYPVAALRRQMALVDQNVVLFNGSVADNIAYGVRASVTEEQIVEAARAAYAWDFIDKLPQKLDTPLGQSGVMLSGGQRQRIAIARALLRNAPILILDEATSALDTESERYIQQALERLVQGRTTLVIAHRLSTVQRADLIAVMQDGRIVESGRHEELLARNGLYASLYQMQFSE